MKRIRELTFITLALLVAFSFFAQYAVTASAPGTHIDVSAIPGEPAQSGARGSFLRQIFYPSPVEKIVTATTTANSDADLHAAISDVPAVVEPVKEAAPLTDMAAPESYTSPGISPLATAVPDGNYCDSNFVGSPITFSQTSQLRLDDLLDQIHNRFGINFLMGPRLRDLPINIKTGSIPWNILLKSQLFVSNVRARCITANTIELV